MYRGGTVLGIPCFGSRFLSLTTFIGELHFGVIEEHRNCIGMAVHDGLLVGAVMHLQNSHLVVLAYNGVMLGISLHRVLSRKHRDKTTAQPHTKKRKLHFHFFLLGSRWD